jgi:hypothetical protein
MCVCGVGATALPQGETGSPPGTDTWTVHMHSYRRLKGFSLDTSYAITIRLNTWDA